MTVAAVGDLDEIAWVCGAACELVDLRIVGNLGVDGGDRLHSPFGHQPLYGPDKGQNFDGG